MRSKQCTLDQMALISCASTSREKSILRTQCGISNSPNPLLSLPLDLHRLFNQCNELKNTSYCMCRSTPVETLHSILLGPYKYLLNSLMGRLSTTQKDEIQARLSAFDYSGLEYKLSYSIVRHFKSFVGRDFKTLAQISLYFLTPYMTQGEKRVWLALSKVSWLNVHVYYCFIIFYKWIGI